MVYFCNFRKKLVMRELKFIARISETGKIQVPFDSSLYDKEVEVILKPRSRKHKKGLSASDFVNKWAGFLKNHNTDDAKFNYLKEKYQ